MPIELEVAPRLVNGAEEQVYRLLQETLCDTDLLGANIRISHDGHDREVDILVALADGGGLTVEVKGGQVWLVDGHWWQRRGGEDVEVDPVAQARNGKYAVQAYLDRDDRWRRRRIRWAHAVVLPHTDVSADFETPDCPRQNIFGRDDLDDLARGLRHLVEQQTYQPPASGEDVADMATILGGRFPPQADLVAAAEERDADAERLTGQQAMILDAIRLLPRVEIRGGAGSGKTWLAVEQARRLTQQGQRVALLCYSRGLAAFLTRRVAAMPARNHRPAYVGTFHSLGQSWGATLPTSDTDSHGWEVRLPLEMTKLASRLPAGHRFDALVVDEAQDFSDLWWRTALSAVRSEEDSGVYAFSDESQKVFARDGVPPISLLPLMLDVNLRNTKQIGHVFSDLTPFRMRLRGGDGPAVRLVECTHSEALDCADDELDRLLDDWRPRDVAILTTGSRHPEQAARQAHGQEGYWASFWDDDQAFYGHVLGFKGLERRVVVLALNEPEPSERSRERLYVGLSRARDQLVVCGDPAFIARVGGDSLLRRLEAGRGS
jgi:hypothetical protein